MPNKKKKRTNTEMSFSPEQVQMDKTITAQEMFKDKEYFKDLLREILDEKFREYLQPVKENIAALEIKVNEIDNKHSERINKLVEENRRLKDEIVKLEGYQRKNNIRFYGIAEERDENLDSKVVQICNQYLPGQLSLNDRTFERIHRLGVAKKNNVRPVIARVNNYKDKLNIFKLQKVLRETSKITIGDDLSADVEQNRRQMYPVMAAIKSNLGKEEKSKVFMRGSKLIFRGVGYGPNDLDKLPEDVNVNKLFTPSNGQITAFFTKHSMLSNHHRCKFTVDKKEYTSMEKFLFMEQAKIFTDHELMNKISKTDDPVEIKRLGKTVKNFKKDIWRQNIDQILYRGLMGKFSQNPVMKDMLLNTGDSLIVEASRSDKVYGIGVALGDQNLWNKGNWSGDNLMGAALMAVRKTLKEAE